MRRITIRILALAVAVPFLSIRSPADETEKAAAKTENKLVGTWKLVSGKQGGQDIQLPEGLTMLKHVTPSHFMWAIYDKDGKVMSALGGPCTLKGEDYEETPEYGIGDVLEQLKGKPQQFKWKVEGNKWHHTGKLSSGLTIEEVWERVEKK
jgi:hypothetical protein